MKFLSIFFVLLLFIVSGCTTEALQNSFKSEITKIESAITQVIPTKKENNIPIKETNYITIKDTKLNNIFENKQDGTYPRVAVTVVNAPIFHAEGFAMWNNTHKYGCYDLKATLWQSKTESETIDGFKLCSPDDVVYDVPMEEIQFWGSFTTIYGSTYYEESSGKKRTTGPLVPETPIPQDIKHKTYFFKEFQSTSYDTLMMGSVLYNMGFDWTDIKDKRVWFVEFEDAYK